MAQAITDTYEYVVKKKVEGKYALKRVLIILAYIVICIAEFVLCLASHIYQLFALAPVSLWIIYYFTWPYFSVEYEYALSEGHITFSRIYDGRKRKEVFSERISRLDTVAPYKSENDEVILSYAPTVEYIAFSSEKTPVDPYFALFTDEKGRKCVFFFEATNRSLRALKYYNQNTVMTTVSK